MAQATNPKIEELRFRIKTDPKSRLFFPLAEELRKVAALSEAESVLRAGLEHHPTYLSAWVSLGRVLREQRNEPAAIEALTKALQCGGFSIGTSVPFRPCAEFMGVEEVLDSHAGTGRA